MVASTRASYLRTARNGCKAQPSVRSKRSVLSSELRHASISASSSPKMRKASLRLASALRSELSALSRALTASLSFAAAAL